MDANTPKGFQPEAQAKDAPAGPRKFRVLVVSELLFAVETLADLPKGRFVVEAPNGELKEYETDKIPTAKLQEGIAAGNVFAHWGAHLARFDEVPPNWAGSCYRPEVMKADASPAAPAQEETSALPTTPALLSHPPGEKDRTERPPGHVPSVTDVTVRLNYQGQYIVMAAGSPAALLAFADQRAIAETHFLRSKAYEAAVKEIKRQWPELDVRPVPEVEPVVPVATQGTLL